MKSEDFRTENDLNQLEFALNNIKILHRMNPSFFNDFFGFREQGLS
jgi:hypothetical protein